MKCRETRRGSPLHGFNTWVRRFGSLHARIWATCHPGGGSQNNSELSDVDNRVQDDRSTLLLTLGASCALHASGVFFVAQAVSTPAPAPYEIDPISLEITDRSAASQAPVSARSTPARPRRNAVQPTRKAPARPLMKREPVAASVAPRGSEVSVPATKPPLRRPSGIDLSPLAAARTLVDPNSPERRPSKSPELARESPRERAEEAALSEDVPGLWRVGKPPVAGVAERGLNLAQRPWELITKPLVGGRYHYEGDGFSAIIRDDGSVDMHDHGGVLLSVVPIYTGGGRHPTSIGVGLTLPSPVEWITNRVTKTDPYRSERLRFLQNTRALRELLLDRAQKRRMERGDRQLVNELKRIWSKQGDQFIPDQHRATLELWNQCSEDEIGRLARKVIERFVRARCPAGSACELVFHGAAERAPQRASRAPASPAEGPL